MSAPITSPARQYINGLPIELIPGPPGPAGPPGPEGSNLLREISGITRVNGLVTRVDYADGSARLITYDSAHGNRIDTIAEGGIVMQLQYDASGLVIGKVRVA